LVIGILSVVRQASMRNQVQNNPAHDTFIIDYFNRTAKPFRWTYTGRPLMA
jgi:hypothetical protein